MSMPLDAIDVSQPQLYQDDVWEPYFARLRREDPVHWCETGMYGSYWSVTRYRDIMQVDTSQKIYSSDAMMGGVVLRDLPMDYRRPSFISMDQPKHDEQRKVVSPIVAPGNLQSCPAHPRSALCRVLDALPRGETFDWVERVSIELTTQMLATLFDFPFEERRKLTYWSNVATVNTRAGTEIDIRTRSATRCCSRRWETSPRSGTSALSAAAAARPDLDAGAWRGDARSAVTPARVPGQHCCCCIVGGNDTTRNSMSGGLLALNKHPDQYRKLRENPGLVTSMVPEIIRWQTPVMHMRRTALEDAELGGKHIRKGDKVAMWYISGNRDEDAIERANEFIIDRAPAAPASVVRFRHPSLRRQPLGRDAADDPVGGDPEALPDDRGDGAADAGLFQHPALDLFDAGAHSRALRTCRRPPPSPFRRPRLFCSCSAARTMH